MTEIPSTNCREDEATLAIILDGPGVQLGTIAAGLVSRYIDALRLGLQAVVELSESTTASGFESQGRRQRWVERIAAIRLVGIESGSVRIRFAQPVWNGLFADSERDVYARALDFLHLVATWLSQDPSTAPQLPGELTSRDPAHRRRLFEAVHRLTPPRRGPIKTVTIERFVRSESPTRVLKVTLDRDTRARIRAEIDRLEPRCGDATDATLSQPTRAAEETPLLEFGDVESMSHAPPPTTPKQNRPSD